jgi:hypothetical protein
MTMAQSLYGRNYWLGAAIILVVIFVMALIFHVVLESFGVRDPDGSSGIIVGLFIWPALIVYHVIWKKRARRAARSK